MKNWSYDEKNVREAVTRMIIRDEMPFRAIERKGLKDAFKAACPMFKMPSHSTVTRDCLDLYQKEREKLKEVFTTSCQRLCVTTDTCTSVANDNYMCVTAHFIDENWKLHKRIINFCFITSHKGESIGRTLEDCLGFWGLTSKLLTVTVDNAASNDVACSYLKQMAKGNGCITEGKYIQMRCMPHILNLIVQDGLKVGGDHVKKVRAMVRHVRGSPARLHSFRQLAEKLKVGCKKSLVNDVPTRWNSTYLMLNVVLKYKAVFFRMDFPSLIEGSDLGPMTLEDWSRIEALSRFLKEFYTLTNRIFGSLYVTSNYMVFHIAQTLKLLNQLIECDDSGMQAMAFEMKGKFDKYWGSIEKVNLLMFVPTILDPSHKLRGVTTALRKLFGQADIERLVRMVKDATYELFDEYRHIYSPSEGQDSQSRQSTADVDESSWIDEYKDNGSDSDDILRSEFDQYLNESFTGDKADVLTWWKLNSPRYPILAHMARDVLAIHISTVASESAFSTGGRTISEYRSNLRPDMVQALVCTQDWLRGSIRDVDESLLENNIEEDEDTYCSIDDNEGTFYVCS